MKHNLLAAIILLAACGGSAEPGATEPGATGSTAAAAGKSKSSASPGDRAAKEKMMTEWLAKLPPEMTKFHDVLSPIWHGDKAGRAAALCGAIDAVSSAAAACAAAAVPAGGDASTWSSSGQALVSAVADIKTKCDAKDDAGVEAAFKGVHEAFHGMLKASGIAKPGHDGDHDSDAEHTDGAAPAAPTDGAAPAAPTPAGG